MYACMYMYMYIYIMTGKNIRMFKLPFVCCTFESKFSFLNFAVTPTLMFAHLHSNMWLIMWACSSKAEAILLAASVSFLSPVMLNPSRNSDRNMTTTCYKAITSKSNIDNKLFKKTYMYMYKHSKPLNVFSTKLQF